MSDELVKSGDLQGKHLIGVKSAKLGTVREVYLDIETGGVAFLVVEPASLFGGSGKYQPVPWNAVRYDTVADVFLIEMDKDQFKTAPSYDREQLGNASYRWDHQVIRYFSAPPGSPDAAPSARP